MAKGANRKEETRKTGTPAAQLRGYLAKYEPAAAARARRALTTLRKLTPGATEMVYDNYASLVIGFVPNDRPSDAILSIAVLPDHISLCFLQAVKCKLPDPKRMLRGEGNAVRHIRMEDAAELDDPAVRALIAGALKRARVLLDPERKKRMEVRAVAVKQRARRKMVGYPAAGGAA